MLGKSKFSQAEIDDMVKEMVKERVKEEIIRNVNSVPSIKGRMPLQGAAALGSDHISDVDAGPVPLGEKNVWKLPLADRQSLLKTWRTEVDPQAILDQTAEIHRRYQAALRERKSRFQEIDARCLEQRWYSFSVHMTGLILGYRRCHWHDDHSVRYALADAQGDWASNRHL